MYMNLNYCLFDDYSAFVINVRRSTAFGGIILRIQLLQNSLKCDNGLKPGALCRVETGIRHPSKSLTVK